MAPYMTRRKRVFTSTSAVLFLVPLLLALGIVFGGSSRPSLGNLLVELAALPLLGVGIFALREGAVGRDVKIGIALFIAAIMLPLLYAIPLAPDVWMNLPGREIAADTYSVAGIPLPWHGAGLIGGKSLAVAFQILPPLAMFIGIACLTAAERRRVVYLLLGLTAGAVVLGLAQISAGQSSNLRFYDITSLGGGVGFFANRNHQASLMLLVMPLAAASAAHFAQNGDARSRAAMASCLAVFALTIVGLAAARSRAGIILGLPALLASGFLVFTVLHDKIVRQWLTIGLAVGLTAGVGLAAHSSGSAVVNRLAGGVGDEGRSDFAAVSLKAAKTFSPVGAGPGTFEAIYLISEPVERMRPLYVNHAHNEYLEIWLEYGLAGALLAIFFAGWLSWLALRAWTTGISEPWVLMARAAVVGLVAVLIHSCVDYPLRTAAIGVVSALLCGTLVQPRKQVDASSRKPTRHPKHATDAIPSASTFGE